jgi:hypothetical protein
MIVAVRKYTKAAEGKAGQLVDELIAKHGVATIMLLRTSFDLGPPVRTTESEAIARVEAARELELAATRSSAITSAGPAKPAVPGTPSAEPSTSSGNPSPATNPSPTKPSATPAPSTATTTAATPTPGPAAPATNPSPNTALAPTPQQGEGHTTDCARWTHDLEVWRRHDHDQIWPARS